MSAKDIAEGLLLLSALSPGCDTGASHDVIMCEGPEPSELEDEILAKLKELDWHWNSEEMWHHYT